MPTYDYRCFSCGHSFEAVQKMSDPVLTDCPSCGKSGEVKRLISGGAFHLKGSGWYKTDYSNGASGKKSSASEGDSDAGAGSTKTESGSEGAAASSTGESKSAESKSSEGKSTGSKSTTET